VEKIIRTTADRAIVVLNDKLVAGLFGYQLICCGHITHIVFACAIIAPLLCFRSVQFLKTNISQGVVATPLRCGGGLQRSFIGNFLLNVYSNERNVKIHQYLAKIRTRV